MKNKKNIILISVLILIFFIFYLVNIINKFSDHKSKKISNQKTTNQQSNLKQEQKSKKILNDQNAQEQNLSTQKTDNNKEDLSKVETETSSADKQSNKETDKIENTNNQQNLENQKEQSLQENIEKTEKQDIDLKEKILNLNSDDIYLGNKDSDLLIFEYTSVTCPHCKKFHESIFPKIKTSLIDQDKVLYIIRDFPTDTISFRSSLVFLKLQDSLDIKSRINTRELLMKNQEKITSVIYANKSNPKEAFSQAMKIIKEIFMISAGISEKEFDLYTDLDSSEIKKNGEKIIKRIEELSKFLGEESGAPTFLIFNKKTQKFKKIEGIKQISEWENIIYNISY